MAIMLLSDALWPTITKLARKAKRRYVAVAYLGHGANRLLPMRRGDSLVVDMSLAAVKSGQTDPREIEKYYGRGVNVYSCSNLHAKVYVFDNKLIIGSANASKHSRDGLVEAGMLCNDPDMVRQSRGFVKSLCRERVSPEFIRICIRLYKPPRIDRTKTQKGNYVTPVHPNVWLSHCVVEEFPKKEEELIDSRAKKAEQKLRNRREFYVYSPRFPASWRHGSSYSIGDLVIFVDHEGKDINVLPPSRIIGISKYRSFNKKKSPMRLVHSEVPNSPPPMSWRDFKQAMRRIGLKRLSKYPNRRIRSETIVHKLLGLWK